MKFLLKFLLCPTYWLFKTQNKPTDQQTPSSFSIFHFAKNSEDEGQKTASNVPGSKCAKAILLNIKWEIVKDEEKFEKCIQCTFGWIIQALCVNKWLTACISGVFWGDILSPHFKNYRIYLAAVPVSSPLCVQNLWALVSSFYFTWTFKYWQHLLAPILPIWDGGPENRCRFQVQNRV